jgi:hypothetical protein
MTKTISAALVVAALALTGACGGGDGGEGRPSKSEVSKSITAKDSIFGTAIPQAAADCVAGVLVDSDLSDGTLNAIVKGDKDYKGSKGDNKALAGLTTKMGKCAQ